jgi:hypothetical protein
LAWEIRSRNCPAGVLMLPCRHRDIQSIDHLLDSGVVELGDRLLEMVNVQFLEFPALLDGCGYRVAVVGIEA